MNKLKISSEISLPTDAVTQTFAMIGRKGAGKTYLASMVAEQMLDNHAQTIVLDCVGVWWGLRVAADGKSKGKDIFVIGGEHGDIPIIPEAGAKIAKLLVEKGISAVLDISGFRIGELKRFAADFAEEFFHLKKSHRSPVHVFIEEAQKIIPQRVGPDEARMVGAFEQIVRLGRNYGIGASLITQRPQSVNKEVLSQVECLCVLQVTGPHERKALEEWVYESGAGEPRTLIGELPGLERGEGYVWSPSWLRIYKRVHFSHKQTFDASATPEVGKKIKKAAKLSSVDVESIKKDMAEVIDQVAKDDPNALRKEIGKLKQELVTIQKTKVTNSPDPKITEKAIKETERRMNIEFMAERDEFLRHMNTMFKVIETVAKTVKDIKMPDFQKRKVVTTEYKKMFEVPGENKAGDRLSYKMDTLPVPANMMATARKVLNSVPETTTPVSGDYVDQDNNVIRQLGSGENKVLVALAQYPEGITREHVMVLVGYKASSVYSYIKRLSASRYIEKQGELYVITDAGKQILGDDFKPLPVGDALREYLMQTLPDGERKILDIFISEYPEPVEFSFLTASSGYKESSVYSYIKRLSAQKLVTKVGQKLFKASDKLYDN